MPTSEREPELYWTDMTDSEFQAQNAPWSSAWLATLARNTECHKRALYGLGSYVGDVPHDHETGESAHLSPAVGVNVIQASCPAQTTEVDVWGGGTADKESPWHTSGFVIARTLSGVGTYGQDRRTLEGGTRGGFIAQRLFTIATGRQSAMFGAGCDVVCSVFVRSTATATKGTLQFGLSGNGAEPAIEDDSEDLEITDPGQFAARSSGVIHYTDLSSTWARFYIRIPNAMASSTNDVRLAVTVAQSFDEKVELTGFNLTHGRRLYPWAPCPGDVPQTPWVFGQKGWQNMPTDVPLLDWSLSMDNAVELEPI